MLDPLSSAEMRTRFDAANLMRPVLAALALAYSASSGYPLFSALLLFFAVLSVIWFAVATWLVEPELQSGGLSYATAFLDIGLITVFVYYTGGGSSVATLAYVYVTAVSAMNTRSWQGPFALALIVVSFGTMNVLIYLDWLPIRNIIGAATRLTIAERTLVVALVIIINGGVLYVIRRLVTSLEKKNRFLQGQALQDPLTGLGNRRAFDERFPRELRRGARVGQSTSLLIFDVDLFKAYNDALGHDAGDACLRRIARIAAETAQRGGDFCARIGGEEFVMLLADTDEEGARVVAEDLRLAVHGAGIPHPGSAASVVTVSVGTTTVHSSVTRPGPVVYREADRALYAAKRTGRNRVFAYDTIAEGNGGA